MKNKSLNVLIIFFYLSLLIALVLALFAFIKYPGKTLESDSFQFSTDYWCDLYKRETPSGKLNPGMLFAKLTTISAVISFSFFWIISALKFGRSIGQKYLIIIPGILGIACSLLLFTSWHDIGLIIGSILGAIALGSLIVCLWYRRDMLLFIIGILVLTLLVACNTVMYLPVVDQILPVLQKLSFVVTIVWMFMLLFKK